MMATRVSVQIVAPTGEEDNARAAIAACFEWLEEVERRLTRFQPESELSRLNATPGAWVFASGLLYEMAEQSLLAAERSGGLFDPTVLSALEALGYDRDFAEIAHAEVSAGDPAARAHRPDWRGIELNHERRRIRLREGTRIDLGGIAKGWAADVALESFFGDFPNVLINVGGDLRARGRHRKGEPWPVGVGDPRNGNGPEEERHLAVLTLGRGGLATSGATGRWWYHNGERQHHLLDPRTGQPMRIWVSATDGAVAEEPLIASATALAPSAAHAEVAAKVALLRGYPDALRAVEEAWVGWRASGSPQPEPYGDAGVALLLVLGTGEAVYSAHLPDYLKTLGGGGNIWLT